MMEAQHTPGPWSAHVAIDGDDVPQMLYHGMVCVISTEPGREVMVTNDRRGHVAYDELAANARLIAKAPEMEARIRELEEALQAAVNGIQWYMDEHPDDASEADHEFLSQAERALAGRTEDQNEERR